MIKFKDRLKNIKALYAIIHRIHLIVCELKAIPKYLNADHIHLIRNQQNDETKYLILQYEGKSGLMTQMVIVLGWLRYALHHGFILVVDMTNGFNMYKKDNENAWEKFYRQPMITSRVDKNAIEDIMRHKNYAICPSCTRHNLQYERIYKTVAKIISPKITFPLPRDFMNRRELQEEYEQLYKKYICFSPDVEKYVENEYDILMKNKGKVLGVLVRGSDYTQSKPYMHPVQPKVEDVIDEIESLSKSFIWDYIYLATEEEKIEMLFREKYAEKVIVNTRHYYNADFSEQWLCDVNANRKDDEYLRGLEYASSIYLLSQCDMLVGGLCGGTQAALLMNNHRYSYVHLFELGNY